MPFPLTPSSSPIRQRASAGGAGSRRPQPPPGPAPVAYCKLDEYGLKHAPGYIPMQKEELEMYFRAMGATDETMQQAYDSYNRDAEAAIGPSGPGVRMIGGKPDPNDPTILEVPIKDTELVIRIWEGGMMHYSQFCLDFFDTRAGKPVNLPRGYSIHPASANMPGVFATSGALPSWETAFGYTPDKIPPGEEKWSVPAGAYLSLFKDRREVVTFAVPRTQTHSDLMAQIVVPKPRATRRYGH